MLFEEDYLDISGELLSEMRLLAEGAITLFEDDIGSLNRLAIQLLCRFVNSVGGADDNNVTSRLAERLRHAVAETAGSAGHDRLFALNVKHIVL